MLELLREIWPRVQQDLRTRAGESAFHAWLRDLRPIALERGTCYLEAKNRLVTERVERLFQPLIEESLSMVTSLAPVIGYDKAAAIAKRSIKENKTVRALCRELDVLPDDELNRILDARAMTEPGIPSR